MEAFSQAESFYQAYGQLASISAVLGGLAFTAAAALLAAGTGTSDPRALNRPAKITIACAVFSTLLLVFSALLWSLLSAAAAGMSTGGPASLPESFYDASRFAYLSLVAGVTSLFVSVGASGWIADRKLGIATTAGDRKSVV